MNPTGTLTLSANSITLAEPLTATITIENPGPFTVTVPSPLLAESSRLFWQIVPAEPAKLENLPGGVKRWSQVYRLEPFVPGEAMPVEFAAFDITTRNDSVAVSFPKQDVSVRSTLGGATELRPLAGPEPVPSTIQPESTSPWLVVACAAVILVAIVVLLLRPRKLSAPLDPGQAFRQRLAQLDSVSPDHPFAERLSRLVRDIVEWRTGEPVTKRTTAELTMNNVNSPYLAILQSCDATLFAGAPLTDRESLLLQVRDLLPPPPG